ncbi:MAG: hypothetical protein ACKVZ0_20375 [Gemmatimonadales bacterium]
MENAASLGGLPTIITLIIALSIATERFVEIIKSWLPSLDQSRETAALEGKRRAKLQLLAAVGGILISYLAWPVSSQVITSGPGSLTIIALGLLASGGSGFWNALLTSVVHIKDLKALDVKQTKQAMGQALPLPRPGDGVIGP